MADARVYSQHAAGILKVAAPSLLLVDDGQQKLAGEILDLIDQEISVEPFPALIETSAGSEFTVVRDQSDTALLQFTSGSTSSPKGINISWGNLNANIGAITNWLQWRDTDSVATWLPLYHDMGLIGTLLVPLTKQANVWQMSPIDFVRSPSRWLECLGRLGATITATPGFGLSYTSSHIRVGELEGLDFSTWRVAILGSDRIYAGDLEKFARKLEAHRFDPRIFTPAYGLAEATLAVSGVDPVEPPHVLHIRSGPHRLGDHIEVVGGDESRVDGDVAEICSAGRCLDNVELSLVDEAGALLGEGQLGEVRVSGASVAKGYLMADGSTIGFGDGSFSTGDVGVMWNEEIYIIGRRGVSIKLRGKKLFAEDVEERIGELDGMRSGGYAVTVGSTASDDVIGVVVEGTRDQWVPEVKSLLRRFGAHDVRVILVSGKGNSIPRTTSGKVRREVLLQLLVGGEIGGAVHWNGPLAQMSQD
jgi:acyl-CoA synthetase (AMP-forming)/AMP-acid ligase II